MKTVAVYGSSLAQSHEPDYIAAYDVGKALGGAGFAVMTGGYKGVMEAVSRGASEAGGHVIGVTTARIEEFRGGDLRPNRWVVDEIRHPTLRERLMHLILEADAYVVMPGGLGTLNELVTVWELMRVNEIPRRPLVCYGPYWRDMLAGLNGNPYLHAGSWEMLAFIETPAEVVSALNHKLSEGE
jgi:uncharacterized protein (TIGR00730 family)